MHVVRDSGMIENNSEKLGHCYGIEDDNMTSKHQNHKPHLYEGPNPDSVRIPHTDVDTPNLDSNPGS